MAATKKRRVVDGTFDQIEGSQTGDIFALQLRGHFRSATTVVNEVAFDYESSLVSCYRRWDNQAPSLAR